MCNLGKTKVETIVAVSKSSITDLKSHSSSSIAMMPNEVAPSSPQLPTKTRSFDDRECLRTVTAASDSIASCKSVDDSKTDEYHEQQRKSSENISLHCEINEPNTNIRQENNSAVLLNASDNNLESSSLLSDGAKVRSESLSLSASPPTITVMCAPCMDDILAETAAQHAEKIECDASDSDEIAENPQPEATTAAQSKQDATARQQPSPTHHSTGNLQLSLEVKKSDEFVAPQEDLSPSMDEYEECNPTSGDYLYDAIAGEMPVPGCVAPAPTPAPLIAPLAEIEVDPPDDDIAVTGIENSLETTVDSAAAADTESTAKPQIQQQHHSHTSHPKKKKQKSTDKGMQY